VGNSLKLSHTPFTLDRQCGRHKKGVLTMIRKMVFFIFICINTAMLAIGGEVHESNPAFDDFFKLIKKVNLSQKEVLIGSIRKLSVDPGGNFWVLDSRACKINKYSKQGEFISSIGRKGQGPGEFLRPFDFCIGKENIFVVDPMARKLNVFSKNGSFKYFYKIEDGRAVQEGKNGEIIIAAPVFRYNNTSACIHIYSKEGKLKKSFLPVNQNTVRHKFISDAVFFSLDQESNIYCIQEMEYKIHKYTMAGQLMKTFFESNPYYIPPPKKILVDKHLRSKVLNWMLSWTHIIGINIFKDRLLFVTLKHGPGAYEYILDVYNREGNFIKGGLSTNYRLLFIDEKGNFFFLQEIAVDSDIAYNILIYSKKR
jgi:hypothetical protein